ncbi:hypothetical protein XA68_13970 [Ophiocordyceps unilateralis]|uniref:Trafficking protein particle complex II-specific subunit 65 IgD3 domain-containing protein n=1 Tax=Ophiocordyceps unilateralis TaxID=268505 RepID=A0A2A9PBI4_OPHUN|nr:hypothetical protein XA68_13970 [Ophiocordyceps unilateralis]
MNDHSATPAEGPTPDLISSSFIEQSYLTYIIPFQTDLDLKGAFDSIDVTKSFPDSVKQRESLFFDETVHVFLLLKTPWRQDDDLRAQFRRLSISLEARVVNGSVPGRDSVPAEETIYAGKVQHVSESFVTVDDQHQAESEDAKGRHIYVVWRLSVFLARPRARPLSPSVIFSASASVSPVVNSKPESRDAGYLPSGLPASINLLESFSNDLSLGHVKPRLSASRVSRVGHVMKRQGDSVAQIRALQQLRMPVFPALHTRIRFSRPNTAPPSPAIVALLEIDFTSHFDTEILLDDISLLTPDGSIEKLNDEAAMRLPLACVSHDNVTFLYIIKPHQLEGGAHKTIPGDLEICITASVQVEPGLCVPRLVMAWHAALDFTKPVNPSFAASVDTGIQRSHRPSQLSIGSNNSAAAATPSTVAPFATPATGLAGQPDSLLGMDTHATRTEAAVQDLGITMSFAGPSDPIHAGDVFSWTVHVVNRSDDRTARPSRKLALVAIPRRRRNDVRPLRPPSTASRRRGEVEVADAVLDDNILHAMQRSSAVDVAEVVCLSADTRVGPLGPGACHVAELQFLALREGIVGVEAIRVVDVNSQEHVDIRDLPTIVVEPAAGRPFIRSVPVSGYT